MIFLYMYILRPNAFIVKYHQEIGFPNSIKAIGRFYVCHCESLNFGAKPDCRQAGNDRVHGAGD